MLIQKRNMFTGEVNTMEIDVTDEQLAAWQDGQLIQHATPELSATEREFMISGLTAAEQKELFG